MRLTTLLATAVLLLVATTTWAQGVVIEGVRMWPSPDNTRLVFDLSGPVKHQLFVMQNPDRIVVDVEEARLKRPVKGLDSPKSVLKSVRSGTRNNGRDLRFVLDLSRRARPKSFLLRPNNQYGHRLVIDLQEGEARPAAQPSAPTKTLRDSVREVVIAIDAGHGGDDPGALGANGTREKDVVLAIARQFAALVRKEPGMRPVLTREGDYFISLGKRVEKARKQRADLFVSIHADAFSDPRIGGASVYTLSPRGATSEHARWLAQSENDSDLVGGVSLDDKDDLLAAVLLDLSQTATMEASGEAATQMLRSLRQVGDLHRERVEQAGFKVLKAPDIPSMLVETAYISNPQEERRLKDPKFQQQIARAMLDGIRAYFHRNPPPGTTLARTRQHVVAFGDTLSGIAERYHISTDTLRSYNDLKDGALKAGEVLRIPPSDS